MCRLRLQLQTEERFDSTHNCQPQQRGDLYQFYLDKGKFLTSKLEDNQKQEEVDDGQKDPSLERGEGNLECIAFQLPLVPIM